MKRKMSRHGSSSQLIPNRNAPAAEAAPEVGLAVEAAGPAAEQVEQAAPAEREAVEARAVPAELVEQAAEVELEAREVEREEEQVERERGVEQAAQEPDRQSSTIRTIR